MCSRANLCGLLLVGIFIIQIFILSCNSRKPDNKILTESGATIHENNVALKLSELEKSGKIKQSDLKQSFLLFAKDSIMAILRDINLGYRLVECSDKWTVFQDKSYFIVSGIAMKDVSIGYLFSVVYESLGEGKYALVNCQIGNEDLKGSFPKGIIPIQ